MAERLSRDVCPASSFGHEWVDKIPEDLNDLLVEYRVRFECFSLATVITIVDDVVDKDRGCRVAKSSHHYNST